MINNKKIIVVLPAYNAEKTLEVTYNEIPFDIVDDVILVDDLITTGLTLTQAIEVLKHAGKNVVFCLTLADASFNDY